MMAHPRQEDIDEIVHGHNGHVASFEYRYENGAPKIFFKGEDISAHLKTKQVDGWSSALSAHPLVRRAVFEYQVRIGNEYDVVAEGRDMGTVVFPHAEYKFFLTASDHVRAQRWQEMQKKQGFRYSLEESLQAIHERDARDSGREASPLMKAQDALLIDASHMSAVEVVAYIKSLIKKE
jgi:cytidylate kinase